MNIHVIAPFIFWTMFLKKTTPHSQIKWQTNFKDDKINHWELFKENTHFRTRQNLTLYMSPLSPWHLLPHILQIMPRNPKYDQFQSKGHHNEENPLSTTKMPGNPKFERWSGYTSMQNFRPFPLCILWEMTGNAKFGPFHEVKIAPKLEKSLNCDDNLSSSEGGQDTSACKISGHFLMGLSRKCPETPNLTCFTRSK